MRTAAIFAAGLLLLNSSLAAAQAPAAKSADSATSKATLLLSGADNRYCAKGNIASFGTKDGPAELPRTCFYTALDGTPSLNRPTRIPAGADLQAALNNAKCGDVLELSVGGVYHFKSLPAKHCDDGHWITVRTAARDAELPPEGWRLTPCYAGVAQLPGRPAYPCPAPKNVMAHIEVAPRMPAPVFSGDHYRFIGIEFTRPPGGWVNALASMKNGTKIVFDRSWFHGVPTDETTRGINLSGSTFVAVVDSYFSDFHCTAGTGACTDAQAICGGLGDLPMGTWKIVNNFLEAAAENILLGGGPATVVPTDVEIRRNHLFKPLIWNPGDPSFFGTRFIVKNHFELKTGKRVVFEGNVMRNVWGGFSQVGAHILLTPKNQGMRENGNCEICEVADVTIRYSRGTRAAQQLQIGNGRSGDGKFSRGGHNYSIHDVIFDDQQYGSTCYKCGNYMNQMGSSPIGPPGSTLHDVKIDHITVMATAEATGGFLTMGGPNPAAISNISWTNSVFPMGKYGIWASGVPNSCLSGPGKGSPKAKLDACWTSYTFAGNVLIGGDRISGQTAVWPDGNFVVSGAEHAFADSRNSVSSKFKGKATDGRDPGADLSAVETATRGVE